MDLVIQLDTVILKIWYETNKVGIDKQYVLVKPIDGNLKIINTYPDTYELKDLKHESFETWRKHDLEYSAILYKSSSTDAQSGTVDNFHVIEIEHTELTGTYTAFFKSDYEESHQFETNYFERN